MKHKPLNSYLQEFERYRGLTGCYAFFKEKECMYVGKATCIFSRVRAHRDRFHKYSHFFAWVGNKHMEGMDYKNGAAFLRLMEAFFTDLWRPIENKQRVAFASLLWKSGGTKQAFLKAVEIAGIRDPLCTDELPVHLP